MSSAAAQERRAGAHGRPAGVRLLVATWPEALPLLGFSPLVTGVGRRSYDVGGCTAVLSAGFAGGCRPELCPGDVVLTGEASPELRSRLAAVDGEVRTLERIATPADKAALGREGAAAVDMETKYLMQAAHEAGLPFLSLRLIIDRLDERAISLATARHYPRACFALRKAVTVALQAWP